MNSSTASFQRPDRRAAGQMRPISIQLGVQKFAAGSVLIAFGDTQVICSANVEERVASWLQGRGQGWVTAEYAMLPGATHQRTQRDGQRGVNGRSQEIQRLIGRALRAGIDLKALGERTITIDCDVLQADGGTRTAAITGGFVALALALAGIAKRSSFKNPPLINQVAALSVGMLQDVAHVDLCYEEDSIADVDLNVVMNGEGKLIEVQGAAEGAPFSIEQLHAMVEAARIHIDPLFAAQREALAQTALSSLFVKTA